MIASSTLSSFKSLESVVRIVFEHRETKLLLPFYFQEYELGRMQDFWGKYFKGLRIENRETPPPSFSYLLTKINHWLEYLIKYPTGDITFPCNILWPLNVLDHGHCHNYSLSTEPIQVVSPKISLFEIINHRFRSITKKAVKNSEDLILIDQAF